jgi:hypothetical protein
MEPATFRFVEQCRNSYVTACPLTSLLHVKHAVQRVVLVPIQHLLWDHGKPRKTLIELAGRRTLGMQTDF